MSDDLKKAAVDAVGQLLKTAGDDPQLKQAGREFAGSVLTVAKAVKVVLLPLAALNYGFDKARAYFEERFAEDLAEITDFIPEEYVVSPKPSIAGPALQGLAFTHEEWDLKNLYLNLLAASMDRRTADDAHPAFVEIIKQLTSQEARLLPIVLSSPAARPIVETRVATKGDDGWLTGHRHVMELEVGLFDDPAGYRRRAAMIDNWVRLGLVLVDYEHSLTQEHIYDWAEERPELLTLVRNLDYMEVRLAKGYIERTAFGRNFAEAVGMQIDNSPPDPRDQAMAYYR